MQIYDNLKEKLQFEIHNIDYGSDLITTKFLDTTFSNVADYKDALLNIEDLQAEDYIFSKNTLKEVSFNIVKDILVQKVIMYLVELIGKKEDQTSVFTILNKEGELQDVCMDARIGEYGYYAK